MVDIARVNLYGQPVGTFRWDNNRQLAHFEYAESFIGKGLEPSPILMPVRQGRIPEGWMDSKAPDVNKRKV